MAMRYILRGLLLTALAFAVVAGTLAGVQPAASDDPPQIERLYLPTVMRGVQARPAPIERNDATGFTKAANAALYDELPFDDTADFDDAQRGFVAPLPDELIKLADGSRVVWDPKRFDFIQLGSKAPDTVNPSLWRQSQLVNISGLFKVTDRIYQVRNYDLSNMTIIEGDTGIIVVDPLISAEVAKASLDLYYKHRPQVPVVAVIYSHSHVDHWGGVLGTRPSTITTSSTAGGFSAL